jgi:hypothetical protein
MNTKQVTLVIAVLSTLATGLLAIEGILSPAWAALVAALGAGAYGIVRALQKRAAGAEWKSLLSTTEAWGTGLAIAAPIVLAVAGLMSGTRAAQVAAIASGLLKLARVLQAGLPGAPQPRAKDAGYVCPWVGVALDLLCATLALAAALLWPRDADAATPQLGTCLDVGNTWCVQPATAVGWQANLATGDLRNGAVLVGYSIVPTNDFVWFHRFPEWIIGPGAPGAWDQAWIENPGLWWDGDTAWLYYVGAPTKGIGVEYRIGLARATGGTA